MSEQYDHFQLGTHPETGKPWAYCLACPSGNGPTIEALRTACRRTCHVQFYDQWGHSLTRADLHAQRQEWREARQEERAEVSEPSIIVDDHGQPLA